MQNYTVRVSLCYNKASVVGQWWIEVSLVRWYASPTGLNYACFVHCSYDCSEVLFSEVCAIEHHGALNFGSEN